MQTIFTKSKDGRNIEVVLADNLDVVVMIDGAEFDRGQPWELSGPSLRAAPAGCTVKAGQKSYFKREDGNKVMSAWRVAVETREEARKARLEAVLPGLAELQAAIEDRDRYQAEFGRMMEDEDNDGVSPPKPVKGDVAGLKAKYPRAAMWVRAESYECAANHHKSSAGTAARKLLEDGGSVEEAAAILENWLPKSAMWD